MAILMIDGKLSRIQKKKCVRTIFPLDSSNLFHEQLGRNWLRFFRLLPFSCKEIKNIECSQVRWFHFFLSFFSFSGSASLKILFVLHCNPECSEVLEVENQQNPSWATDKDDGTDMNDTINIYLFIRDNYTFYSIQKIWSHVRLSINDKTCPLLIKSLIVFRSSIYPV